MKVFITGIAGFLGSNLAEYFRDKGHEVGGSDDLSAGDARNVPQGIDWFCEDCRQSDLSGYDVVYHTAAHPHEGLSVFSPHHIGESIYGPSVATFSNAIKAGVKRIVFCSSMSRYGDSSPPFWEGMRPEPRDPYAVAKVAAEQTLKLLGEAHGVEYVIAVPHNIIGKNQKYDDPFRNVAAIMANRMLQGIQPIVYGDGKQTRCFSDVRDVVPTLASLAIEDVSGETFNIGPDEEVVTIEEMGMLLARVIGVKWEPMRLPPRPLEVKHAHCSSNKIREQFRYQTNYSLMETLQSLVDYIRDRGHAPFNYYLPVEIVNERTPKFWTREVK